MATYQKPTVEEIEDEARRNRDNGIRIQITSLGNATMTSTAAAAEARRLRKRKCPWESTQGMGRMRTVPAAACR